MIRPEQTLDRTADALLSYLRAELCNTHVGYGFPLTQMEGGYEACSFRFTLSGVGGEWSEPLVLRLYPGLYGSERAVWESTVQNALADAGYPAPRAYLTCTDTSILGGVFFVMEFLPGKLMITTAIERIPGLLGKAHAALHDIDPQGLIASLRERGFGEHRYGLGGRLSWLKDRLNAHPWLGDGVDWLLRNRPPEPERLSICHGDFHPMNILVQDGRITGVLDWPGFVIADPVLDVANTVVLIAISAKHLLSLSQWDAFIEMYLAAYRAHRPLDLNHLDYYRARRCVCALAEGADGHRVWQQPPIARDLAEAIYGVTGICMTPPALA